MQMVAIASACALNPEILVLDEPSANLDRSSISDLIELLKIFKSNKLQSLFQSIDSITLKI